jgi:HSP20 family protein
MYESMLSFPSSLFSELDRLQRDFDDLFGLSGQPASIRSAMPGSFPAINVGHTATSVEVYAFAPGIDASQVDVTLDHGVLVLAGERKAPEVDDKSSTYRSERAFGSFRRAVSLPDDIDPERVDASYRDGVLRVSIGRREPAQPQRITVQ